ncbi:hypothetical protein C8R47DRAFT_1318865 [Mycena vitilis]|nr:hypothetical protein C8R47DRAFT_1318865 [Mycena vitilis]
MKNPRVSALPNELLHSISGHLDLENLLALSRTGRQMHAICLVWIYRVLLLQSEVQVLKCLKSMVLRSAVAESVRELKIVCYPKCALKSFHRTLECAIKLMKGLRVIQIAPLSLFSPFSRVYFPRLLSCTVPVTVDIFPFLLKNPTVKSLSVRAGSDLSNYDFCLWPIRPMQMSDLMSFDGPDIVACSVIPGSRVSQAAIFWPQETVVGFPKIFAALAASTADMDNLSCVVCTWDPSLLPAIAKHMPRLACLHIQHLNLDQMSTGPREDFHAAIENALRSLPCLTILKISEGVDLQRREIAWTDEDREFEFELVQRWGEISSTVLHMAIGRFTPWIRFQGLWFPDNIAANTWLLTKILSSPRSVWPESSGSEIGFQNFSVTIPKSAPPGAAQLNVLHFSLIGVTGPYPYQQSFNVTLEID